MAGLTLLPVQRWTSAQSRAQFAALAQLRWCLFRNAFRRKGGIGELVARIIFIPLIGIFACGPIVIAGIAGHEIFFSRRFNLLPALTWGIFALWQLVSINISPPGMSFDINTILRFPISFPRYLTARLFFGLLSASNVIGTLALIAADIGIGIARPSLLPWSTLLLAVFALANIFFTRMVFAWLDRWLSTRRARELLTAFILCASLGFQYLNVTFNPGLQSRRAHHTNYLPVFLKAFHLIQPVAAFLPPGLTATSVVSFIHRRFISATESLLELSLFAAIFLAIYGWRMRREFTGENLNEGLAPKRLSRFHAAPSPKSLHPSIDIQHTQAIALNSAIVASLQKEFIYLRRNTNQLYGFLAPIFMVFLFAGRIGASERFGALVFPASVAYSILGVSILSYNSLGMDGAGVQFYFLSPARLRDVVLAKNLIGFALNLIGSVLIYAVIVLAGQTPSPLITAATASWLLFTTLTNAAVGNLRSFTAPRKIDFSKISRKQTSQLSALIAVAVVSACVGIAIAVVALAGFVHRTWLMIPLLLILSTAAFIFYMEVLSRIDSIAMNHRETLTEELCKP